MFQRLSLLLLAFLCACSGGTGAEATDAGLVSDSGEATPVPDATTQCEPGELRCGGNCIDPMSDRAFCGATTCDGDSHDGTSCSEGFLCSAGACEDFTCEVVADNSSCNPVTQAGCAAQEKCDDFVESTNPFLKRTACVPEGDAQLGESCSKCADDGAGYDNCQAGLHCLNGTCAAICDSGPPDTCRTAGQAFDEGSYCTLFANVFSDSIGLCVAACNPTNDTVVNGVAINSSCGAGTGCYLNATSGAAACAAVPAPAADLNQNEDCYGPATGGCFLNGCASGFTALLNDSPIQASGSVCARFCEPVVTHSNAQTMAGGAQDKCSSASLAALGGTNGSVVEHQCRFVQTFYNNTQAVSQDVGMCVPITVPAGDSWGDCKIFDWDGLKAAENGGVGFDEFCLEDPNNPDTSEIKPSCMGYFRGCISLAEEAAGLP